MMYFQKRLGIIVSAYELLLPCWTDVRYQLDCNRHDSWCWWTLPSPAILQWRQLSSLKQATWLRGVSPASSCLFIIAPVCRSNQTTSVLLTCCPHECRSIKCINDISRHSCLQTLFSSADVAVTRCNKKSYDKIYIDFYGRSS